MKIQEIKNEDGKTLFVCGIGEIRNAINKYASEHNYYAHWLDFYPGVSLFDESGEHVMTINYESMPIQDDRRA